MKDYIECPSNKFFYKKDSFPKVCSNCHITYHDRLEYLQKTVLLPKGTFCQGDGEGIHFFEFRNCQCGNTLTIAFLDRRDYSEEGKLKRKGHLKKNS